MVIVAQLVRASVCGTEGRRFEPGHSPKKKVLKFSRLFSFIYFSVFYSVAILFKIAHCFKAVLASTAG